MSLGLEDGRIQDGAMSVSSKYNYAAKLRCLNLKARAGNAHQWLQIDLGGGTTVTKVVTQGRQDFDQWATNYYISYVEPCEVQLGVRYEAYSGTLSRLKSP